MNFAFKIYYASLLVLIAMVTVQARAWKNIEPLKSTRADVVRLFTQCAEYHEGCEFKTESERVYMLFSGGIQYRTNCVEALAPETVMFIEVVPLKKLSLKDLGIDRKKSSWFRPFDSYNENLRGYYTADGLITSAIKDDVWQVVYVPERDMAGRCAELYDEPEPFVQTFSVHPPPSISLECVENIGAKETSIAVRPTVAMMRGAKWTVTNGRILSGQYTQRVLVEPSGESAVIVSAELSDIGIHWVTASCTIQVKH